MLKDKLNQVLAAKKSFLSDPMIYISIGVSLLLLALHAGMLLANISPGRSQILLQYNVIYGPRLVEKSLFIYAIPLLALIMLIVNTWIAGNFYHKEKLAAYFLSLATCVVQAIFFAAALALIIANE